jgi:hypothetical protein
LAFSRKIPPPQAACIFRVTGAAFAIIGAVIVAAAVAVAAAADPFKNLRLFVVCVIVGSPPNYIFDWLFSLRCNITSHTA